MRSSTCFVGKSWFISEMSSLSNGNVSGVWYGETAELEHCRTSNAHSIPSVCGLCTGHSAQEGLWCGENRSWEFPSVEHLLRSLQKGGSRAKMEAATIVRSLAASHAMHQAAFVNAGGILPLVKLLNYEARERHWPQDMRLKATITVRAEAALALADLAVSKDENKAAIGAAGAIPLLCSLLHARCWKQELAPFLVLAKDAAVGALSCLAKDEANKRAIVHAQAIPALVGMVDHGTSFGRAAAANVLAKLAAADNAYNKSVIGKEGAIPPAKDTESAVFKVLTSSAGSSIGDEIKEQAFLQQDMVTLDFLKDIQGSCLVHGADVSSTSFGRLGSQLPLTSEASHLPSQDAVLDDFLRGEARKRHKVSPHPTQVQKSSDVRGASKFNEGMLHMPCTGEHGNLVGPWANSESFQGDNRNHLRQERSQDQLVTGGVYAVVNALRSQNPGAQEFAALALVLLASQGGHEVKTLIAEAGAFPLLLTMIRTSSSSLIRESAAAAIAELVSFHAANRLSVIRAGGTKALVDMAKSFSNDTSCDNNVNARIQAAAIVAILNLSEAFDTHSLGMGITDALPHLAALLESGNSSEIGAGLGGLQAISSSLGLRGRWSQTKNKKCTVVRALPVEMVLALLDGMKGSLQEGRKAAIEALYDLGNINKVNIQDLRKDGVELLLLLLENTPAVPGMREAVAGTFSRIISSRALSEYFQETKVVPCLMRLVSEGPTLTIRILALAGVANLGVKQKKLESITKDELLIILNILANDFGKFDINAEEAFSCLDCCRHHAQSIEMPHFLLLREHAATVLVYSSLSGHQRKDEIVAAGGIPILVQLLQESFAESSMQSPDSCPSCLFSCSKLFDPMVPQVTQEFAMMALILLADKSSATAEKVVQAGGISLLLRMLGRPGAGGKFGAKWSEMAAAALLTMAGCDAAREKMIHSGGIPSLLHILKGDSGATMVSYTGVAAMVQLLGIFALNNHEAKIHMTKNGVVRCLVEILVGGGCLAWASDVKQRVGESSGSVALAQEAAASALANLILECPENAEASVEAGAIGPLVRLLISPEAKGAVANDRTYTEGLKGVKTGCPVAAMAALRNILSCYPRCRQEIIDAGGLNKLTGLLEKIIAQTDTEEHHHKENAAQGNERLLEKGNEDLKRVAELAGFPPELVESKDDAFELAGKL